MVRYGIVRVQYCIDRGDLPALYMGSIGEKLRDLLNLLALLMVFLGFLKGRIKAWG